MSQNSATAYDLKMYSLSKTRLFSVFIEPQMWKILRTFSNKLLYR